MNESAEIGDQFIGQTVGEILLSCVAGDVFQRENGNRPHRTHTVAAPQLFSTSTSLLWRESKSGSPLPEPLRCFRCVLGETSAILYSGEGPTGVAKGHINR